MVTDVLVREIVILVHVVRAPVEGAVSAVEESLDMILSQLLVVGHEPRSEVKGQVVHLIREVGGRVDLMVLFIEGLPILVSIDLLHRWAGDAVVGGHCSVVPSVQLAIGCLDFDLRVDLHRLGDADNETEAFNSDGFTN